MYMIQIYIAYIRFKYLWRHDGRFFAFKADHESLALISTSNSHNKRSPEGFASFYEPRRSWMRRGFENRLITFSGIRLSEEITRNEQRWMWNGIKAKLSISGNDTCQMITEMNYRFPRPSMSGLVFYSINDLGLQGKIQ